MHTTAVTEYSDQISRLTTSITLDSLAGKILTCQQFNIFKCILYYQVKVFILLCVKGGLAVDQTQK